MKFGIISDTHDRLDSLLKAYDIFVKQEVSQIIHCGDWVSPFTLEFFDQLNKERKLPVKSVFGNNEGDIKRILERNSQLLMPIEFAPKIVFEFIYEQKKFAIFHGHDTVVLRALIASKIYNVIFTGHTHEVRNEVVGNTLVFNPGTTCFASKSKILEKASVGIYTVESASVEIVTFS